MSRPFEPDDFDCSCARAVFRHSRNPTDFRVDFRRVPSIHGASAVAFDGTSKHGPQSYTLLTGFEDTEMSEEHRTSVPMLSGTQYGELN